MTNDPTEQIRDVLAVHGRLAVDAGKLDRSTNLYNAGLTSHASVNVMLALEDTFDIEFPERLLKRSTFESIENLLAAIDSVRAEG